jgi:hypothetical protein
MAFDHIELDVSFLVFLLNYDFLMTRIGVVLNQMILVFILVCLFLQINEYKYFGNLIL